MRTKLEYTVQKEEKYNYKTDRMENHIVSRGFEFSVSGAKTEEEHESVVDSFGEFLKENNIACNGFGEGSWKYCKAHNDTQSFYYLDIPIDCVEDKEYIKELYKEWKRNRSCL